MNPNGAYRGNRAVPSPSWRATALPPICQWSSCWRPAWYRWGPWSVKPGPTVPFNTIEVSVVFPGAVPEEVEESIVVKIEEQVEALEDAKAVKSLAAPGLASVRVELKTGADIGEAMDEVKSAVGRIQSFPGAAERTQFREMDNRTSMIRLIVFGDISERSLKEVGPPDRRRLGDAAQRVPGRDHRDEKL